jgi:hypothetical protein
LVPAAAATCIGPIKFSEPGVTPCGSCAHIEPKASAPVVTPSPVEGTAVGVAEVVTGFAVLGAPPQADSATLSATMAPTATSRWIFLTSVPPQNDPAIPDLYVPDVRVSYANGRATDGHDSITEAK